MIELCSREFKFHDCHFIFDSNAIFCLIFWNFLIEVLKGFVIQIRDFCGLWVLNTSKTILCILQSYEIRRIHNIDAICNTNSFSTRTNAGESNHCERSRIAGLPLFQKVLMLRKSTLLLFSITNEHTESHNKTHLA